MMHFGALSAHNWMRPKPFETTLTRLKRLGYGSIELSGEPDQYPIKETKSLLQKYGIKCWGTATLMVRYSRSSRRIVFSAAGNAKQCVLQTLCWPRFVLTIASLVIVTS